MNRRNEEGKTIIPLLIVLVILITIIVLAVRYGQGLLIEEKLETLNTDMITIQAKCKIAVDKDSIKKDESTENAETTENKATAVGKKGKLISEITDNEQLNKLIENKVISTEDKYYLLSQEDFESLNIKDVNANDGYLINYETDEVVYLKGFNYEGNTYYKLSDLVKFQ